MNDQTLTSNLPEPGNGARATATTAGSVCAIIVAFFPDIDFEKRILKVLPQVAQLVIVDNTPDKQRSLSFNQNFNKVANVHLIVNHANLGISTALNQGLEYALNAGHEWILTLDQDTQCYPDIVDTLLSVYEHCNKKPAVIGGNYFDPRNAGAFVSANGPESFLEQKTVITSGCLVNSEIARAIGGFREDYFIDQVDHEFCLRMRRNGHTVVISRKTVMNHSVGRPGGAYLPLLGVLPNHPPLRKYYIARNTLVTVAEYWQFEPAWCLRRLLRLLMGLGLMALLEEQRFRKVRAFAAGVMDGLYRRMGPCSRESIYRTRANTS